jgi:hypothetical protein
LHGDPIALRAADTPWFVVAESGGGGNVLVNSGSRGGWESFTILFLTPHQAPSSLGQNRSDNPRFREAEHRGRPR